jgi:AraC-like DNA-binding protein
MTMFLAKMPAAPVLEQLVSRLPEPLHQLFGQPPAPVMLPTNIVCFQRSRASGLNKPHRGRALHHRFVLIFALRTAVTVCVDDRNIRLHAGEGLLVLPFQFHHYTKPERDGIAWLFVTFELPEGEPLAALRYESFKITPRLRALATELVEAYESERMAELPALLLGLMLARLRRLKRSTYAGGAVAPPEHGLMLKVDQLAQRSGTPPTIPEIARTLGISPSHLRARFRASCGVSIGRHLRQVRLEQARGLLRLGPHRVSEIAEQCGFTSIFSFSRAFRTAYGLSPLAYRHGGRMAPAGRR